MLPLVYGAELLRNAREVLHALRRQRVLPEGRGVLRLRRPWRELVHVLLREREKVLRASLLRPGHLLRRRRCVLRQRREFRLVLRTGPEVRRPCLRRLPLRACVPH